MSKSITVRKMYKYRLYRNDKKDKHLRYMIFVASTVWNHFIALQRRYYRFKLAHKLCKEYDTLYFEDLNLAGMKAM